MNLIDSDCASTATVRGRYYVWRAAPGRWHAMAITNAVRPRVECTTTPVRTERLWGALEAIGLTDPARALWKATSRGRVERMRRDALQAKAA